MTKLNLSANLGRADDFYAALLSAHDGLTLEETHAFNARLILVLANHVGDHEVLEQALKAVSKVS